MTEWSLNILIALFYDWRNYFIVIGWEQVNLLLIFNLHCSVN